MNTSNPTLRPATPLFAYGLRNVTEAAAIAAYDWIGRGDKESGDGAAVEAMRAELNRLPIDGRVVIGEGEKDEAPALYNGETVGNPNHPAKFDIAVDPVEGTSFLAKGLTNAMAVIALAPRGSMMEPGPAFYMEKFAGPQEVAGKIDPHAPVADKLNTIARETGKPIEEVVVYVLEKSRHKKLVQEIHAAGARAWQYPAGDVAGALLAAIPGSPVDCLMGTGGTPEGILCAVAIRAMGGEFFGRFDPQIDHEVKEVAEAGLDTTAWYGLTDLAQADPCFFCATGITHGLLFDGVRRTPDYDITQSLIIAGQGADRQFLTSYHPRG